MNSLRKVIAGIEPAGWVGGAVELGELVGFGPPFSLRQALDEGARYRHDPPIEPADHLYTTSALERDRAVRQYRYLAEGVTCFVHDTQAPGTVPLYRLGRGGQHLYTTSALERDQAVVQHGFVLENMPCYVYENQSTGTAPLYRLPNPSDGDRLYTTSALERDQAVGVHGWVDEGIACYVHESPARGTVPLYRASRTNIVLHQEVANLGGWVKVTLGQNGAVRFRGHVHNSGVEGFEFRARVVVRGDRGFAVAMLRTGHVGGLLPGDRRDEDWDETSYHPMVAAHFRDMQPGLQLQVDGEVVGDIKGPLEDILDVALRWVGGTILIGSGVGQLIFLGAALVSLVFTGSLAPGARVVAGVLWLAGPWGTMYALAAEGVSAAGSRTRELTQEEYEWAQAEVFNGTLPPRDQLVLTDTIGGRNAAFVFPRYDGKITINMGEAGFADPRNYRVGEPYYRRYGEKFIHELVHTWQIHHTRLGLAWLADALVSQTGYSLGAPSYEYGPPGPPFGEFNLEQQADIVSDWFAGNSSPTGKAKDPNNPYFKYIEGNIRKGIT